jgi:hypothetical protein
MLRTESTEDEVEVADVVAGQHGTAGTRNVLGAVDANPEIEHAEHRPGQTDDRWIYKIRHGVTVVLEQPHRVWPLFLRKPAERRFALTLAPGGSIAAWLLRAG